MKPKYIKRTLLSCLMQHRRNSGEPAEISDKEGRGSVFGAEAGAFTWAGSVFVSSLWADWPGGCRIPLQFRCHEAFSGS